jgi:hypothetical protein
VLGRGAARPGHGCRDSDVDPSPDATANRATEPRPQATVCDARRGRGGGAQRATVTQAAAAASHRDRHGHRGSHGGAVPDHHRDCSHAARRAASGPSPPLAAAPEGAGPGDSDREWHESGPLAGGRARVTPAVTVAAAAAAAAGSEPESESEAATDSEALRAATGGMLLTRSSLGGH